MRFAGNIIITIVGMMQKRKRFRRQRNECRGVTRINIDDGTTGKGRCRICRKPNGEGYAEQNIVQEELLLSIMAVRPEANK
jgi:hypothetical protein